ncbi:GlxA family transcriptional regulator [Nocardia brasiliensis]|uniref:AraC family transcription regulator n=1 Tax=Nocardia brasiliensis (strain ATCC 700358 / HUJEG-1) TaxID=1133849 RepID=K0EYA2_NOCB7|nr:helix-turn-helix domain-containing protein [Nocardia brasiliensis]AFU01820.1 AraC family transcription regulator [Nocardia brasiliensis ATCC 700358]OCF89293.1 AraC family transcriptional regulator [Nocardia brasiliensis]
MPSVPGTLAVLLLSQQAAIEVALACQAFGTPPHDHVGDWYDLRLCGVDGAGAHVGLRAWFGHAGPAGSFGMCATHGLDDLATADTVLVPGTGDVRTDPPAAALAAIRAARARGARMVSLCSGAFVLAAAGVLDGRTATSHWEHAALLASRFPAVRVDPNILYTDEPDVLTSAGLMAGIDLCLHVIRADLGSRAANAVARRMIVPPHRAGGQAQYLESPVPAPRGGSGLGEVLEWAMARLDQPTGVGDLAAEAGVSVRTLIRRFHAELGTTPSRWLLVQRLARARELLEHTGLPVDLVAAHSGLGTAPNLRAHFARELGLSPTKYRRDYHPGQ